MFADIISAVVSSVRTTFTDDSTGRTASLAAAVFLITFLPFGTFELVFMALGAALYLAIIALDGSYGTKCHAYKGKSLQGPRPFSRNAGKSYARKQMTSTTNVGAPPQAPAPVPQAPVLQARGWDAEVDELMKQITPTTACDAAAARLALRVKQALRSNFPDIDVTAYLSGNMSGTSGAACRVAVPDLEIVATVPELAAACRRARSPAAGSDVLQLQKTALRTCIDRLVQQLGMKFRRSAFRGRVPKVTFLLPADRGISNEAMPLDFFVNSTVPANNRKLLDWCATHDPRAEALCYLTKRWAKDRGICHASKGHLPPQAWTLLAIYYLQNAEEPLLPVFSECDDDSSLNVNSSASLGTLFKGFIQFYAKQFDWKTANIVIRASKDGAEAGTAGNGVLHVQDPFDISSNLASEMTAESIGRLHEELARALALACSEDESVIQLLEPWKPPTPDELEKY